MAFRRIRFVSLIPAVLSLLVSFSLYGQSDTSKRIRERGYSDTHAENVRNLGKTINSEWWDSQPSVSKDGQLLFFASDRKHGHGGADIYMCTRSGGTWNAPIDLSFNTSGNELSPFIASDNQTLYFAAD